LKGRLVGGSEGVQTRDAQEDQFVLEDDGTIFTARLMRPGGRRHRTYQPGSLLQLTGVCVMHLDDAHEARSFELLLRSPADIVVLENAPWWNVAHTGWVIAVGLLAIVIAMAVRAFLKRDSELRALAATDPLTGLYNRRSFLLLGSQLWRLALRRRTTLLLFYLDVDRFKEINDSLGHQAGDDALRAVAAILRGCFRTSDVIARLGGDEFAVACDALAESPAAIEQRLDAAVEQRNRNEDNAYHLALSIGSLICDSALGIVSFEELVKMADKRMYERKRERRSGASERRRA
jgi:diguanylate cyclase (GGDEF)-like protein